MSTDAKRAGNARHIAKLGRIELRPYKEEDDRIRAAAEAAGQSLQGYILQAVRERMERDAAAAPSLAERNVVETEGGRIFDMTPDPIQEFADGAWGPVRSTIYLGSIMDGRKLCAEEIEYLEKNGTLADPSFPFYTHHHWF